MNLESRLSKLENQAKARTGEGMKLYDSEGNEVEGKVLRMPTADTDGLAKLLDGTKMLIQAGDPTNLLVFFRRDGVPEKAERGKLRLSGKDTLIIDFVGVDLSGYPKG